MEGDFTKHTSKKISLMNFISKLTRTTFLAALAGLFFINGAYAQEEEEGGLSLSGSIDTYYRVNLNSTNDPGNGGTIAPGSSFANLPGFSLGMFNMVAAYDGENSGFVADVVFGPRGTDAVFASPMYSSTGQIINQLYAYWNATETITLTMGNFNTFLGYEVISPSANFNYSTSYMFSYGPFSHTGLKADIALGEASLMLGVFNDTDLTEFNPNGHYYGGAQFGIAGQYFNLLFSDDYFQVDYTGGFDISDVTYLGINATYNNDLFFGGALYLQQSFSDDFALGFRGEYFGDVNDVVLAMDPTKDESVIDLTLSANYSVGKLTLIPEFRVDLFSEDAILTDGADLTSTSSSLASFLLAAVYTF